jgi:hypothetical protein
MCGGKRRNKSRASRKVRRGGATTGGAYSAIGPAITGSGGSTGMAQIVPEDTSSNLAGRGGNNSLPEITPDTANASGFPDVQTPVPSGGKKSRRASRASRKHVRKAGRKSRASRASRASRRVHRGGMSPVVWSANTVAGSAPAQSVPRTGYIFNGSGTNGLADPVPY